MKETVYRIPGGISCRIALLSDLHNRPYSAVLRSLRRRRPDLIAVTGDLLVGYRPKDNQLIVKSQEKVLPFLRACVAIAPTYVSLGNHEWVVCEEDLDLIRSTGVTLLDNSWVAGDGIAIGGLTSGFVVDYRKFRARWMRATGQLRRYPKRRRAGRMSELQPDAAWLKEFEQQEGVKILLCHHPEYWSLRVPYLKRRRIDLVFSGHAHGGQIRLFGRSLFAPAQGFLPKYTGGVHTGPHGRLVISRGLANTAPLIPRIGNPTEIVYVLLTQTEETGGKCLGHNSME